MPSLASSQEIINQVEEKISREEFSLPGLSPAFNTRVLAGVKQAYSSMKNAEVHWEEGFAFMGVRGYAFFKSSNENIYVIERYMGKLDRVFKVTDLFGNL